MFKVFQNINSKFNALNVKFNSSINKSNKEYREHEGVNILKKSLKEDFLLKKKVLFENQITEEPKSCLF